MQLCMAHHPARSLQCCCPQDLLMVSRRFETCSKLCWSLSCKYGLHYITASLPLRRQMAQEHYFRAWFTVSLNKCNNGSGLFAVEISSLSQSCCQYCLADVMGYCYTVTVMVSAFDPRLEVGGLLGALVLVLVVVFGSGGLVVSVLFVKNGPAYITADMSHHPVRCASSRTCRRPPGCTLLRNYLNGWAVQKRLNRSWVGDHLEGAREAAKRPGNAHHCVVGDGIM